MKPEQLLPKDILKNASLRGKEYAWHQSDVEATIRAAKQIKLATIGGQVQFRFSDGTYELYWLEFDSTPKNDNETWDEFVERSADECLNGFKNLCKAVDFISEGLQSEYIQEKAKTEDIGSYLCFVVYFDTEESYFEKAP